MSVSFGQSGFSPEAEKEKLEKERDLNGDYGRPSSARRGSLRQSYVSLRKSIGGREPGHETKDPFAGGGDVEEGDEKEINYRTLEWW